MNRAATGPPPAESRESQPSPRESPARSVWMKARCAQWPGPAGLPTLRPRATLGGVSPAPPSTPASVDAFIQRWSASTAHERAVYQHFFVELCDLLEVPRPDPATRETFGFEKLVVIPHGDGRETPRWIDFYKRGAFVLEAKQGSDAGDATIGTARRGTGSWAGAMRAAWAQALQYALHLPDDRPPFLITCDIGHVFEVWTGFSGHYGDYGARRTVPFAELANPATRKWLRTIFLDPWSLDPSRHAARVTGEVAVRLAALARTLEARTPENRTQDDRARDPAEVAGFLMRCIFTMFAEDIGLIPTGLLRDALRNHWLPHPETFVDGLGALWEAWIKANVSGCRASS